MRAKFVNESVNSGRIIKVKCQTNSDCGNLGDVLSGEGIFNTVDPLKMIVTINIGDNDPIDVLSIVDRLPFPTKIINDYKNEPNDKFDLDQMIYDRERDYDIN